MYIGHPQYLDDFPRNRGCKLVPHGSSGFLVQKSTQYKMVLEVIDVKAEEKGTLYGALGYSKVYIAVLTCRGPREYTLRATTEI